MPQQRPHETAVPQPAQKREAPVSSSKYPFLYPPVQPDELGRLGNYRVLCLLGKGGMGYVFHAEDLALGRAVALKVMKPCLDSDAQGWQRFIREARVMAAIKDESLVTVYQIGQEGAVAYLAMELLEGASLEDWLAHVPRPDLATIQRVAREIAGGLAAIHCRGLVHRDVKPANLWVEAPSGRVKILDFGLARFVNDNADLTQSGVIVGTPSFMSPEQARGGEPVDARTDLFSFGCVLYNLCTGTNPFLGDNTLSTLAALAVHNPCPVRQLNPEIPEALSDLVARLMAKRPQERPASAEAVLECLQRIESRPAGLSRTQRTTPRSDAGRRVRPADTDAEAATAPMKRSGKRGGSVQVRKGSGTRAGKRRRRTPTRDWVKIGGAIALTAGAAVLVPWAGSYLIRPRVVGAPVAAAAAEEPNVYLSSLDPVEKVNWPFLPPPPPGRPPLEAIGVRAQGKDSPHGIFMHPPPGGQGAASLTYRLRGGFRTFHAEVSLGDGVPYSNSPVTFAVYGDGRLLWKSKPVQRPADAQACTVSARGVDRLKIEVSCGGDPAGGHAVWIEPSLGR